LQIISFSVTKNGYRYRPTAFLRCSAKLFSERWHCWFFAYFLVSNYFPLTSTHRRVSTFSLHPSQQWKKHDSWVPVACKKKTRRQRVHCWQFLRFSSLVCNEVAAAMPRSQSYASGTLDFAYFAPLYIPVHNSCQSGSLIYRVVKKVTPFRAISVSRIKTWQ